MRSTWVSWGGLSPSEVWTGFLVSYKWWKRGLLVWTTGEYLYAHCMGWYFDGELYTISLSRQTIIFCSRINLGIPPTCTHLNKVNISPLWFGLLISISALAQTVCWSLCCTILCSFEIIIFCLFVIMWSLVAFITIISYGWEGRVGIFRIHY